MTNENVSNLPMNSIIIWYGKRDAVPKGWAICNGQNDTPDLRGRFVVGVLPDGPQSPFNQKETGGNISIKLTTNQMPAHSHGTSQFMRGRGGSDWASKIYYFTNNSTTNEPAVKKENNTASKLNTDKTGSNDPINILPPYMALFYIMKITD